MADLLALSSRIIDEGEADADVGLGGFTRVNLELSEVAEGISVVESFSHVWSVRTGDGLVVFDTSVGALGPPAVAAVRGWTDDRFNTIVYTHGHVDHVGGAGAFMGDALDHGHPRPAVVSHQGVPDRFDRYDLTNGYNAIINQRQFAPARRLRMNEPAWPRDWVPPTTTFASTHVLDVGGVTMVLRHDRGETDDHLWAWLPERRAILSGDLFTWVFPNAGNPPKVQRYPLDWARALRAMIDLGPELLLPAHGLPVAGRDRIATVLSDAATALEGLVEGTLAMMNAGARLDDIVATVKVPEELLAKPYLRPTYDEPEFVVRNLWRLYGGWYDGNPARLKPPTDVAIATETARLAGGADVLARRAQELAASAGGDDLRLAAHLAELATQAAPEDAHILTARSEVYGRLRDSELSLSLMARGIYAAAADAAPPVTG